MEAFLPALPAPPPVVAAPWPDTFTSRIEALALLEALNVDLLSHDSATITLDHWCGAHRLASPPEIVAERIRGADKPATMDVRAVLKVQPTDLVRYRRVRLRCGDHVLSEADNWYVPARLTPEMNQLLDSTDIAFGRAVQTLHFQRRTISVKTLWAPLPDGWEMGQSEEEGVVGATLSVPHAVLEHRAVLTLPDGAPISEVIETYTGDILKFSAPTVTNSYPSHAIGTSPDTPAPKGELGGPRQSISASGRPGC